MSKQDPYNRLVEAIDNVATGMPRFFGLEKLSLKRVFSAEDAEVYADMIPRRLQTPAEFAEKNEVSEKWAENKLYDMSKRGLIFRGNDPSGAEGAYTYCQFPLAFGLIEFQLANPDKMAIKLFGAYAGLSKFGDGLGSSMPMYRSIPFRKELAVDNQVLAYDDVEALLQRHDRFAVTKCMCRELAPSKDCDHPKETCIMTDDMADFYVENGWGRNISRDVAYEILIAGESDGRVIQVNNSKNAENICSCCSCGCKMVKIAGRFSKDRVSGARWSNYTVSIVEPEACNGCGACETACSWGIVKVMDNQVLLPDDLFGCMGCGACVAQCQTGAIKLAMKPGNSIYEPPDTIQDAHEKWHDIKVNRL